jgi:hypothetical protein
MRYHGNEGLHHRIRVPSDDFHGHTYSILQQLLDGFQSFPRNNTGHPNQNLDVHEHSPQYANAENLFHCILKQTLSNAPASSRNIMGC